MTIELKKLAFDQYQRYRDVQEIVSIIKETEKKDKLKILDVGGHCDSLSRYNTLPSLAFLRDEDVTVVDVKECNIPNYIKGDGKNLPFDDGAFDIAISLDVFEHIPPEQRESFVNEMLRVCTKYAIIIAPFANDQNVTAEFMLFEYIKNLLNIEQYQLKEHLENGLPDVIELKTIIQNQDLSYCSFPSGYVINWLYMNSLKYQLLRVPNSEPFHHLLDEYYNKTFYESDHKEPSYRQVVIISKQKNEQCLVKIENRFKIDDNPKIHNNLETLSTFKTMIVCLNNEKVYRRLEDLTHQLDKEEETKAKEEETKTREEEMKIKYDTLNHQFNLLNQELHLIKRTKGWRALEKMRRIRNKLLSANNPKLPGVMSDAIKLDITRIKKEIEAFNYLPKISVVMPVYNVEEKWLAKAIKSVREQVYDNWELCICDDASTEGHIKPTLQKYEKLDSRIKVVYAEENEGISGASNNALAIASGEYIALLDNDDELTPDAFFEVVKLINNKPEVDLIYSDEDKIDLNGNYCDHFFKPDWNPDLLLTNNYICHLGVYRRSLITEIKGFRKGFEGSQDYDLVLRFTELTNHVYHIPKVLYHWRKILGSTSSDSNAKPYAINASLKALQEAMTRRNTDAKVLEGLRPLFFRVKREIIEQPLVSIIIPTKNKVSLLKTAINSIVKKTQYKNYEIIIIDNNSDELGTIKYLEKISNKHKIIKFDEPFNYAKMNNMAVKHANGQVLLFLNNDIKVINEEWLESMLEQAQRAEVGAVGAKLYYPNDTIQHAGVIIGMGGVANHGHLGFPRKHPGYFGFNMSIRNYSAVTAACMMVRKDVFEEIGGFDEINLKVAFNDVDFCLRLREKGYLILFTPYAELYHYESATRGRDVDPGEVGYMMWRWRDILKNGDPYYNPNLTLDREDFSLR